MILNIVEESPAPYITTLSSPVNKSISLKALPITSVPHQKELSLTIMLPLFQPTISVPILQFGQLNQYTATIILHNLVFDPNRHALGEHWSRVIHCCQILINNLKQMFYMEYSMQSSFTFVHVLQWVDINMK